MRSSQRKKGPSKEELERIAREAEEKRRREELLVLERAAEDFQAKHNEERDFEDQRERDRLKREHDLKVLAERDASIAALARQVADMEASIAAERSETERELTHLRGLAGRLQNDLSRQRTEADEAYRLLLTERDHVVASNQSLDTQLHDTRAALDSTRKDRDDSNARDAAAIRDLEARLRQVTDAKDAAEREFVFRIRHLERENEKATLLNATLQEVIEAREVDEKKNITLLQLLNSQLDESKRRHQELLDEERLRTRQVKEELAALEVRSGALLEENALQKRELESARADAARGLSELRSQIDRLKFDTKFLSTELNRYKAETAKQQEELSTVRTSAQAETQQARVSTESLAKKIEELEALLRRKERDHADKVAFLNAQISNNRVIISQLQQKSQVEREDATVKVGSMNEELDRRALAIQQAQADLQDRKAAAKEVETKLHSDISILKTTVFKLQAALVEREREVETLGAVKEEEILRLRRKLDEHFIPHRTDIPSASSTTSASRALAAADGSSSAGAGAVSVGISPLDGSAEDRALRDKMRKLQADLEVQSRIALESETRLKAQLANQNHIIDALQTELLATKEEAHETVRALERDNLRLRQTLDVHSIEYPRG